MEILIIDGYNVLNAWPELLELTSNLEMAREKLLDILLDYGAYKDLKIIVVFDAHLTKGQGEAYAPAKSFEVVYTRENQTADSYIERVSYDLAKNKELVRVVTSDYAEQMNILGSGAFRVSAREFLLDVAKTRKEIRQKIEDAAAKNKRREVGGLIQGEVLGRLEALRRVLKDDN